MRFMALEDSHDCLIFTYNQTNIKNELYDVSIYESKISNSTHNIMKII